MAQQIIDIGTADDDGTGDPFRTAFNKTNQNFTELYTSVAAGGSATDPTPPQGRLTLQTATPVMTTTQSGKTTIYYSPYIGNKIGLYDGSSFTMTTFAELSVATTDTTKSPAAIGASKVNDWFVWNDAGTIRVGHGPDWTSDTARSAGTALTMVNGILLNNASITNGPAASRGTYVGTTRSNASSQMDWIYGGVSAGGTAGLLNVWNCYNRVLVSSITQDSTTSAVIGSNPVNWMNNAGNRCSFVSGLAEDSFVAVATGAVLAGASGVILVGIGLDATTHHGTTAQSTNASSFISMTATDQAAILGYHYFQMLSGSITANGNNYGILNSVQTGGLRVTGMM